MKRRARAWSFVFCAVAVVACGEDDAVPNRSPGEETGDGGRTLADGGPGGGGDAAIDPLATDGGANSDGGSSNPDGAMNDSGSKVDAGPAPDAGPSPTISGCPILPSNHIFNTRIDSLPVHPSSEAFMTTIGTHNIHLDLGTTVDQTKSDFYGIPYNVVHGSALTWVGVSFTTADSTMTWNPRPESDCANGAPHTLVAPCTAAAAPNPVFPIPVTPLVEGGIDTDPSHPYGDHHILLLDADTCRLWELYHAYPKSGGGGWDIFGSASFDLRSNALRPDTWTSADAAGFPMLPLLLRADEASSGVIRHALRFTVDTHKIRTSYVWPARHLTENGTASTDLPPMGQLFRLKASFVIPAGYSAQSKAILQAMKTYGMYIADGGTDFYVTGEPNAAWASATFSQVQSVSSTNFEAVDTAPILARPGFSVNSAAVPPP